MSKLALIHTRLISYSTLTLTAENLQANFCTNPDFLNGPKPRSRCPSSVPPKPPCSPRSRWNDWRVRFSAEAIQHAVAIQEKDAAEETKFPRVDSISEVVVGRSVL